MGKIFCLTGKSSSGKDTVYRRLAADSELSLHQIVLYTTRPIREGEEDGREYHFVTEEKYLSIKAEGKMIEERVYQTVAGPWRYFTVDDGSIDLSENDYLVIGTLESYVMTAAYFGKDRVVAVYIETDDGERLLRAVRREQKEPVPRYNEVCRRFIADTEDFSEDKLCAAGITRRFTNDDIEECLKSIREYIAGMR